MGLILYPFTGNSGVSVSEKFSRGTNNTPPPPKFIYPTKYYVLLQQIGMVKRYVPRVEAKHNDCTLIDNQKLKSFVYL